MCVYVCLIHHRNYGSQIISIVNHYCSILLLDGKDSCDPNNNNNNHAETTCAHLLYTERF